MSDDAPTPPPARTEAAILADPRLREFLEAYHPLFREIFLRGYARLLEKLHREGHRYEADLADLLHQFEETAREHLWEIQHKKLFDLQARWQAGQAEVPGARLTADFDDWHERIETCPVLPPITPDEVALYDAYLAACERDPDLTEYDVSWTRYWYLRRPGPGQSADEAEEEAALTLPEWNDFYDQHRGTTGLRHLPDLRGPLEEHYVAAWRQHAWQQTPNREMLADPRPYVPTHGPDFDALARQLLTRYEPPALLRAFDIKQHLDAQAPGSDDELDVDRALALLRDAGPDPLPIEAHADWRQALCLTAHRHRLRQIRRLLPDVYDDYCRREQLGIAHPTESSSIPPHGYFHDLAERIRAGRVLLGEPDDLDF